MAAGILLRLGRPGEAAGSLEALAHGEGVPGPALRSVARGVSRGRSLACRPGLFFVAALFEVAHGVYSWAGSTADAVRVVETGVADRNPWIGVAAVLGEYDGLRGNPRFVAILEKLGLPNGNTTYRERPVARSRSAG